MSTLPDARAITRNLTIRLAASCPTAAFRLFHIRNRTAMRWRGGLGARLSALHC